MKIIAILCLTTFLFAQAPIAVMDFEGKGISQTEASALTDRLRTELYNGEYFVVVERGMMEEILTEQGFQQSGCTTNECIVEVGKLVGVDRIVGGSISKVGNLFSVSARVVSVETGEIFTSITYDHSGKIEDLLSEGMKLVAMQLGGEDIIKEKVSYSGIRKYLPKTRKGSALLLFTVWIIWGLLPPA